MRWKFAGPGGRHGCDHCKAFKDGAKLLAGVAKAYWFILDQQYKRNPLAQCMDCAGEKAIGSAGVCSSTTHDSSSTTPCNADAAWFRRIFLCMHCVYVVDKVCLSGHGVKSSHFLFIDTSSMHIFCTKCNDYVYDGEFERIERRVRADYIVAATKSKPVNSPWLPATAKEQATVEKQLEQGGIISSGFTAGLGLRGLCNLGNTCFTSCVIQSLVHNPLLRNYFLMGMHKKSTRCCTITNAAAGSSAGFGPGDKVEARWGTTLRWYPGVIVKANENSTFEVLYNDGDTEYEVALKNLRQMGSKPDAPSKTSNDGKCLGCAMSNIFFEMYSGVQKQLTPHKLLYSVWQHSKHLAGYSQQDAHEFFLALLDGLHTHLGGSAHGGPVTSIANATIIQQVFTGALQSDLACLSCKRVSTTIDPFWDISLDIRSVAHASTPQKTDPPAATDPAASAGSSKQPPTVGGKGKGSKAKPGANVGSSGACTLLDCLTRYTRAEQLSSPIHCSTCGSAQPCTKTMSVNTLPMVVCFHLKRFEHEFEAVKIDSFVQFPETLDMTPFLARTMHGAAPAHSNGAAEAAADTGKHDPEDNVYSLFAVVNHHGTFQNGHYTNFVRLAQPGGQWFLCDDESIRMAASTDVLQSEGYMLFYIKRRLLHKE
eukprot:m.1156223 g.1156223  ORF g.1156223 m.1156223 type:complete len:652 (-) comp24492_c0_seq4:3864-5819(-)